VKNWEMCESDVSSLDFHHYAVVLLCCNGSVITTKNRGYSLNETSRNNGDF